MINKINNTTISKKPPPNPAVPLIPGHLPMVYYHGM
jgi:hypothetical protein